MRTELPKKWCINREKLPLVQEWFIQKATTGRDYKEKMIGWYTHYPAHGTSHTSDKFIGGYEEITFEEFQVLVLNQPKLDPIYEIY